MRYLLAGQRRGIQEWHVRERMQGVVRRFSGGRASKNGKGRMKGRVKWAYLSCVRLG